MFMFQHKGSKHKAAPSPGRPVAAAVTRGTSSRQTPEVMVGTRESKTVPRGSQDTASTIAIDTPKHDNPQMVTRGAIAPRALNGEDVAMTHEGVLEDADAQDEGEGCPREEMFGNGQSPTTRGEGVPENDPAVSTTIPQKGQAGLPRSTGAEAPASGTVVEVRDQSRVGHEYAGSDDVGPGTFLLGSK